MANAELAETKTTATNRAIRRVLISCPPSKNLMAAPYRACIRSRSWKSHPRDVRVPSDVKPPGFVPVLTCVVHIDAWTHFDLVNSQSSILDSERVTSQTCAIETLINSHRHTKLPWAARDIPVVFRILAQLSHGGYVLNWLHGANQNCGGMPFDFGNRIETKIEAVNHVDVGTAAVLKHDRGSGGLSFGCVTSQIFRSDVRLGLDDLTCEVLPVQSPNQNLAEQTFRNFEGGFLIEGWSQFHEDKKIAARAMPRRLLSFSLCGFGF